MKIKLINCSLLFEIDDWMLYKVELHRWRFTNGVVCTGGNGRHSIKRITLANHLLGIDGIVDHINRKPLDNHLCNLRPATAQQNAYNAGKRRNGVSSQYIGVSWYEPLRKWAVHYMKNGTKYNGGYFDSEIEAAKVYDKAISYRGEFGVYNFPKKS